MAIFTLLTVALCIGTCACINSWDLPDGDLWEYVDESLDYDWLAYTKNYNKTYDDEYEMVRRRLYWEANTRYIKEHNLKYKRGESTFFMGESHLTDMPFDEYEKIFMSGLIIPPGAEEEWEEGPSEPDLDLPTSVNWVTAGKVTSVKNQGYCGSCWAFSAVGALESQQPKVNGREPDLSEQNLVDCSTNGNMGCRGGWMNNAFRYIQQNGGINSESCYRYTGRQGYCRFNRGCVAARDSGYTTVPRSESGLDAALTHRPVAIAVDANHPSFQHYRGGIYNERYCNSHQPTHAMLAAGYGTARQGDYYIVKNSWGTNWGQQGYIYMSRKRNNQCGIANFASYPNK